MGRYLVGNSLVFGLFARCRRLLALMLQLLKRKEPLLPPLAAALSDVAGKVRGCTACGNLDVINSCAICADPKCEPLGLTRRARGGGNA